MASSLHQTSFIVVSSETHRQMGAYLECGKHLSFFFTISEIVVILHGDERRELILDSIVWSLY